MARSKTLVALGVSAILLAGCAGDSTDQDGNRAPLKIQPHLVTLPDGQVVQCIWERSGYAGGLSCNWNGIKR